MTKKEDQIQFNLTQEEFTSLMVNKLAELQCELEILSTLMTGVDASVKNEQEEDSGNIFRTNYEEDENEQEENSGNIFRSNDERENLMNVLNGLLKKNKKYRYERKLKIIADMIATYSSSPGSGLPDEGSQFPGQNN